MTDLLRWFSEPYGSSFMRNAGLVAVLIGILAPTVGVWVVLRRIAYLGDARYNVGNSVLVSSALMGMDVRIVAPEQYQPATEVIDQACGLAEASGARVTITDDIDTGVRSSPAWLAREELLVSVPGIGPVIARTLISEIPELGSLDRRSVASLAGLAPFTRQSGQWKGKSMIAAGRAPVRAALFIAVMVASRFNPTIKAFHQRLRDAGKPKMVALIACARKLLTILNAILRDQKPWQNA